MPAEGFKAITIKEEVVSQLYEYGNRNGLSSIPQIIGHMLTQVGDSEYRGMGRLEGKINDILQHLSEPLPNPTFDTTVLENQMNAVTIEMRHLKDVIMVKPATAPPITTSPKTPTKSRSRKKKTKKIETGYCANVDCGRYFSDIEEYDTCPDCNGEKSVPDKPKKKAAKNEEHDDMFDRERKKKKSKDMWD